MSRTRVKLCGLRSDAEVDAAVAAGADAVGFIVASPRSKRDVALDAAERLARRVAPFVTTVAVTAADDDDTVDEILDTVGPDAVQVAGTAALGALDEAREGGIRVIRSFRPAGPDAAAQARKLAPHADALLLDALAGTYGGTGDPLDPGAAAAAAKALAPFPVVLAGGLTPTTVGDAVRRARPFAVDVSSGIETGGVKDSGLMAAFVQAVREADAAGP